MSKNIINNLVKQAIENQIINKNNVDEKKIFTIINDSINAKSINYTGNLKLLIKETLKKLKIRDKEKDD